MISIVQPSDFDNIFVHLVSGADLQIGANWDSSVPKDQIQSMSGVLRIGKTTYLLKHAFLYMAYLDLHTTRNLYLTSSALASYTNISNFGNDVIIKKIPVKANYGQMLFDTAATGYDYVDVPKRALNCIDVRLQDSYGNVINLRNNHWSFSTVFQIRN